MVKWKLARRLQCISVMLASLTSSLSKASSTLATFVGLRRKVDARITRQSESRVIAMIVAEAQHLAQREADRQAALDACPAMVDATRAYLRMELRNRACEGDAFALSALRMMAA
jgi:hypothetical protein